MRKAVIAFIAGCIVAGGGAWYAFSYLPAQIQAEIDAAIASLAPRVIVKYKDVSIDVFERSAVFSDVSVQEAGGGISGDARRMTVATASNADAFDLLLENPSVSASKNPEDKFFASNIRLTGLSINPAPDQTPSENLAFLKRLNLRRLTIAKIEGAKGKLKISRAELENLADAYFAKATITGVHGKEAGKLEFSTAEISAERVNVFEIATLPKTFRGHPDWEKLNTGKIAVSNFRIKFPDMNLSVANTQSDGVKAGRIVRFRIADAKMNGQGKNGKPFSFRLEKFEMNNFPIITDFPTNISELRSFQTRYKSLIYDGFDIRGLKIASAESSLEVRKATLPKPVFRKTPSGAQYAAKATMTMDVRGDFRGLRGSKSEPNPIVSRIFKDLKGRVTMTASSTSDHEKKTGTIEAMEISIPGVARLAFSGQVGNLPMRYYETPNDPIVQQIALRQATLGAMKLTLVNEGLAEALLEAGAVQDQISPEDFAKKLAVMVRGTVGADGSPEGLAIAKEIGAFLQKPRSIHLSVKPSRTLPVMALGNPQLLQSVGQVSRILGLKIEANKPQK